MGYKVAVVGASGAVGGEMLSILAERNFPADEVVALASSRSIGREVSYGDATLRCQDLETYDFKGTDIALFSPGAKVSDIHAPRAAAADCIVIDNTSRFRYDEDIPLVVPEVNPHHLEMFENRYIISNPNCSTIQMLVALKPLHDLATIRRVIVATYQATGGAGKKGMDELYEQTKKKFWNESYEPDVFQKEIAFNCIPHIDVFMDDGSTREEWKMVTETKKILDPAIAVHATCVRVPVFVGHAEAINIEFENPLSEDDAREQLMDSDGVIVFDEREAGGYVTQKDCAGEDAVYVSRLRQDPTVEHGLALWVVSDNLRKGAALNAVQIAEEMDRCHLQGALDRAR
ncbi:MAG: aspartate-semialdehyde dehydrogenase [Rhodospirillales bacterium]|nr:aspartate-semialdehyde dehydrogenase [Rhodospirillales bacterium]